MATSARLALAILSLAAVSSLAPADPVPVSIERFVESSSEIQVGPGDEPVLDRGTFFSFEEGDFDEQSESIGLFGLSITEGRASQVSTLSADSFNIEGSISGFSSNNEGLLICQTAPVTGLEYTFDVTEVTPYHLAGRLDCTAGGVAAVRLDAAFLGPNEILEFAQETVIDFDHHGELQPGRYILRIECSAYISPGMSHSAMFVIQGVFGSPPCSPDTNGDGILDNGDIITFVSLFLAGNIAVDMNGDGILDNGDINTFVSLFLAGC